VTIKTVPDRDAFISSTVAPISNERQRENARLSLNKVFRADIPQSSIDSQGAVAFSEHGRPRTAT
jgi:hypothetical protein